MWIVQTFEITNELCSNWIIRNFDIAGDIWILEDDVCAAGT